MARRNVPLESLALPAVGIRAGDLADVTLSQVEAVGFKFLTHTPTKTRDLYVAHTGKAGEQPTGAVVLHYNTRLRRWWLSAETTPSGAPSVSGAASHLLLRLAASPDRIEYMSCDRCGGQIALVPTILPDKPGAITMIGDYETDQYDNILCRGCAQ